MTLIICFNGKKERKKERKKELLCTSDAYYLLY